MNLIKQTDFNVENKYIEILKNELEFLKEFVAIYKETSYAIPFRRVVERPNEDGVLSRVTEVDENQMLACIITGRIVGLDPTTALSYGNTLDDSAIIKVSIGRHLGLDANQSLLRIHTFKNKEGKISVVLSTQLIEAVMIKYNISIEVVENFKPVFRYETPNGKELNYEEVIEDDELKPNWIILNPLRPPTAKEVTEKQAEGFKYCIRRVVDYRTTVKAVRGKRICYESVTRQDAIDWGLYPGVTTWGETREETGRMDMWKKRLPRMMQKTALSNVADRIASDLLYGTISDATYSQYDDDNRSEKFDIISDEDDYTEILSSEDDENKQ